MQQQVSVILSTNPLHIPLHHKTLKYYIFTLKLLIYQYFTRGRCFHKLCDFHLLTIEPAGFACVPLVYACTRDFWRKGNRGEDGRIKDRGSMIKTKEGSRRSCLSRMWNDRVARSFPFAAHFVVRLEWSSIY